MRRKGESKPLREERWSESWLSRYEGAGAPVDVAIPDEGKGIILLLGGRGSDPAQALSHSAAMYAIGALSCLD